MLTRSRSGQHSVRMFVVFMVDIIRKNCVYHKDCNYIHSVLSVTACLLKNEPTS